MPSKPAGPPRLLDLPADIRHQVLSLCSATDLLSVSRCCLELSAAAKAPELWAQLLQRHHGVVIDAFFEGAAPPPPHGSTWQRHFFHFERTWLLLARAETGRMLLRMRSECAASSPTYLGVPPPAVERAFTLRLPLLGLHLPIPLWLQQPAPTYGIFDATDFAARHPGTELLLAEAAAEDDCTARFDAASHSERARAVLRRLVVPGLEAMPVPRPPPARRRELARAVLFFYRQLHGSEVQATLRGAAERAAGWPRACMRFLAFAAAESRQVEQSPRVPAEACSLRGPG